MRDPDVVAHLPTRWVTFVGVYRSRDIDVAGFISHQRKRSEGTSRLIAITLKFTNTGEKGGVKSGSLRLAGSLKLNTGPSTTRDIQTSKGGWCVWTAVRITESQNAVVTDENPIRPHAPWR